MKAIHQRVAPGHQLLDEASLLASLARPMQGGFGRPEFYPTAVEKAAALLHSLARTQPFSDGNKRIAWASCVTFLRQNDMTISPQITQDEVVKFVLEIANNLYEAEDVALRLLEWVL